MCHVYLNAKCSVIPPSFNANFQLTRLLSHSLFLDPECKQECSHRKRNGRDESHNGGALVAVGHLGGYSRGKMADILDILTHALLNLTGIVPCKPAKKFRTERLLEHGRDDANTNARAKRAEEIRARNDNSRILHRGIRKQANQRSSHTYSVSSPSHPSYKYKRHIPA